MPDSSNPFRRPHSARFFPATPVDEELVESIFGIQEQRVTVEPTSGRTSEVGHEGGAADRKPKSKPPPPAPRRRGTQRTKPSPQPGVVPSVVAAPVDGTASTPLNKSPSLLTTQATEHASRKSIDISGNDLSDIATHSSLRSSDGSERTSGLPTTSLSSRPQSAGSTNVARPISAPHPETTLNINATPESPTTQSSHDAEAGPPSTLDDITITLGRSDRTLAAAIESPPEVEKRVPPPPPLSRRVSVRSSTTPEKKGRPKSMLPPPPPPPVRRSPASTNRMSWHGGASDVAASHVPLPLPPTPPQRRKHGPTGSSHDGNAEPALEPLGEEVGEKADRDVEGDILVDLEALQREVDQLRGKYGVKNC